MDNICFKYKDHPGDFFRTTDVVILPNPEEDLESFLVHFLKNYQSDIRVTYINDLYKFHDYDFFNEEENSNFSKIIINKTEQEVIDEIKSVENELKNDAYKNFYDLVQTKQIEIIDNGKK